MRRCELLLMILVLVPGVCGAQVLGDPRQARMGGAGTDPGAELAEGAPQHDVADRQRSPGDPPGPLEHETKEAKRQIVLLVGRHASSAVGPSGLSGRRRSIASVTRCDARCS